MGTDALKVNGPDTRYCCESLMSDMVMADVGSVRPKAQTKKM